METICRTVRLHPKQFHFRHSPARYRAFVGGRGAGKSFAGAYDLLRRLRPGGTYLVGSPTGVLMQDTTFPTLKELAESFGVWGGVRLTPYPTATVLLDGGTAQIRFRTAEDPEKMRGPNLRGVWLDETSLMHRDVYRVVIGSLRDGGHMGWLSATFTPRGPSHWSHETFATKRPDTAIFRAGTKDNPFVSPEFVLSLARQYGDTQFARQELGGEFVSITGAWFPAEWFDRPDFWYDDIPPDLVYRVVALDPSTGGSDVSDWQAYVLAAFGPPGNTIYLDAELNREPPPQMIARGLDLCRGPWGPVDEFAVEENATMGFIGPEVARQCQDRGILVPWRLLTQRVNKLDRIRGLAGYLSRGQIRVRNTPGGRLLVAQLRDVPFGEYDDGPDAAASAVRRLEQITTGV